MEKELSFPCVGIGEKTWTPTEDEIALWKASYPYLDLEMELRQMHVWILANPQRRKTAAGMARFVVNWLNRSNNRGLSRRPSPDAPRGTPPTGGPDTGALRRQIEVDVRSEHPDWKDKQVRDECAKRFNAAVGA